MDRPVERDIMESLMSVALDKKKADSERLEAVWTLAIRAHRQQRAESHLQLTSTIHRTDDGKVTPVPGLSALFTDPSPGIRASVALLYAELPGHFGGFADSGHFIPHNEFKEMVNDPDPTVQAAVAIALRRHSGVFLTTDQSKFVPEDRPNPFPARFLPPAGSNMIAKLIEKAGEHPDPVLSFHIWQAIEPGLRMNNKRKDVRDRSRCILEWLHDLSGVAKASNPLSLQMLEKAVRRITDERPPELLWILSHSMITLEKYHDEESMASVFRGLLTSVKDTGFRPDDDITSFLEVASKFKSADAKNLGSQLATLWGDPAAIRQLAVKLLDTATPEAERVAALQTLRKVKTDDARTTYAKLLSSKPSTELLQEALRSAGDLGGAETPVSLVALWKTLPPALRTAAAEALIARADWAAKLLDAVEEKKITRGELPITTARYFANQPDAALKKRAEELIGAWKESNADTKALIAAKRKVCLEGEPDLAAGKLIFTATCMVCHSFHGGGQKVGPDLIGSGRSNLDALLANVIDPNQIIGNGYENIIVTTKDNRTVSGRMTEDTPSYVKLLAIGGAEQVVSRDQIATLTNTHQSVMPQGFGGLPDDVFRNLVWYVLSPPEEGPLTPEKKKMLSQGVEGAEAVKKKGTNWHAIDWESVSLWNAQWKVEAPEFDNTPVKLTEFHGCKNVLLMHPFTKDKPSALERKVKVEKDKLNKLSFYVASHDQGDWELHVKIGDEVVKKEVIDHAGERWKHVEVDLSSYAGKEITVRLEGVATGWHYEFGYWSDVTLE